MVRDLSSSEPPNPDRCEFFVSPRVFVRAENRGVTPDATDGLSAAAQCHALQTITYNFTTTTLAG
jgi:hypothetical protein